MLPKITHELCGVTCELHGDGTIYVPSLQTLFIADIHVGKTGQFRKEGIPAPKAIHRLALSRLEKTIVRDGATQVVFLGDLFEGKQNKETEDLKSLFEKFPQVSFVLVKGNHDFDLPNWPQLKVYEEITIGPFICLHEPPGSDFNIDLPFDLYKIKQQYPSSGENHLLLCGHLHPGATLRGKGRSRARIKAFFIGETIAVLPAYGALTGHYPIKENGQYFGIVENSILNLGSWSK